MKVKWEALEGPKNVYIGYAKGKRFVTPICVRVGIGKYREKIAFAQRVASALNRMEVSPPEIIGGNW